MKPNPEKNRKNGSDGAACGGGAGGHSGLEGHGLPHSYTIGQPLLCGCAHHPLVSLSSTRFPLSFSLFHLFSVLKIVLFV